MMSESRRHEIEEVIRSFPFDNYGLNEVEILLHNHPEDQQWVAALADDIEEVIDRSERGI